MSVAPTYTKPFATACRDATAASTSVKLAKIYSAVIPLVLFSAVTAVVSFCCLYKYLYALDAIQRGKVWRLHGWFCAMIFCCSVLSFLTWPSYAVTSIFNVYSDEAGTNSSSMSQAISAYFNAKQSDWQIVFNTSYPFEFSLLSIISTIILTRMTLVVEATSKSALVKRRIKVLQRSVMVIVGLGCLVGICGNIATSVSMYQVAQYSRKAGDAWSNGDTAAAEAAQNSVDSFFQENERRTSVMCLAEIVVLLSIVIGYIVSGIFVVASHASAIRASAIGAAPDGVVHPLLEKMRHIRRQVVITVVVTFVSLLIRCVYAFMNVFAGILYRSQLNGSFQRPCDDQCADCQDKWEILDAYLDYAPNFQCWVIFFSEPVTLLVSLWGMISPESRKLLFPPKSQPVSLAEFQEAKVSPESTPPPHAP